MGDVRFIVLLLTLFLAGCRGGATRAQGLFEQMDLFVGGQDDFNTYRIPALICTRKGTVLAFSEGRRDASGDGVATDIVLKRSLGNAGQWKPAFFPIGGEGRFRRNTMMWQPLQVVVRSMHEEAYMNPVPLIDQSDGAVYLLVNPFPQPYKDEPADIWLLRSTDEGATWSKPVDLTPATGRHALSPGVGIQLESGRLLVAGYDAAIFSDDHGKTWRTGSATSSEPSETAVVELADGTLMLNRRGEPSRVVFTSRDKGETWSKPLADRNLPDADCEGSLVRLTRQDREHTKNRLLFANPVSGVIGAGTATSDPRGRFNITVRLSYDEGETWPVSKLILKGPGAYSSMTAFPDGSIGILFEAGYEYEGFVDHYSRLVFARFTLDWLTDGKDHLEKTR